VDVYISNLFLSQCNKMSMFARTDMSPSDLLRCYIAQFGDKPCCFADLRLYTDLLSTEDQRQVTTDNFIFCFYVTTILSLIV